MNPKALSLGELYGEYDLNTNEWTDGVLSSVMRTACAGTQGVVGWGEQMSEFPEGVGSVGVENSIWGGKMLGNAEIPGSNWLRLQGDEHGGRAR